MADLLDIEGLVAGYGEAVVLSGISLALGDGRSLALLGRNGTGKTTLINSILGLTTYKAGTIRLSGRDITRMRPDRRAHEGLGWTPQERNIFRSLTVEENMTAVARPGPWTVRRIYDMFPRLEERKRNLGNQLSGGEQQMLALGRALMTEPRIRLIDEPSVGLAPLLVKRTIEKIKELKDERQLTVLMAEQNFHQALTIADRGYVIVHGEIVFAGNSAAELNDNELIQKFYMGL